jgi:hypothetical protein
VAGEEIDEKERQSRYLKSMSSACFSCALCELGAKTVIKNNESRDPHVFSNRKVSKIIYIGLQPTWLDLVARDSQTEITVRDGWFNTDDFYVTNLVKCAGECDSLDDSIAACLDYLSMEIRCLKPKLIITIDEVYDKLKDLGWVKDNFLVLKDARIAKIVNITRLRQDKSEVLIKLINKINNEESL